MRPCASMRLARSRSISWSPLTSLITGSSNTSETRSGDLGVPRTLDWPSFQLAMIFGAWPISAIVSGPLISLINNFGS